MHPLRLLFAVMAAFIFIHLPIVGAIIGAIYQPKIG